MRSLLRRTLTWLGRKVGFRPKPSRVSDEDRARAYRLFLGREPVDVASFATNVTSPRALIRRCLGSDAIRSEVVRFGIHRRRLSLFDRPGRPDRDDLAWLARVVPLSSKCLADLAGAPDWRAFYAVLFRAPEFQFALDGLRDGTSVSRLLLSLGPPLTMRWPEGWRSEPGPLVGNFDALERGVARGWLWNPDEPNQPARIEFVVGGEVVHSAYPNSVRADVRADGRGTGFAGFETQLPRHLIGSGLVVGARLAGSRRELADALRRLELPPPLYRWQVRRERVAGPFLDWLRRRLDAALTSRTLQFVLSVSTADADELRRTMAGIAAQWCSRWELVFIARPETPKDVLSLLRHACVAESRISLMVNRDSGDDFAWFLSNATALDGTIVAPLTCGDDLEPDTVHRFLQAAATGAEFFYADEIVTLDGLLDAILPFRRSPFEREWRVAHPGGSNVVAIEAKFARRLAVNHEEGGLHDLLARAGEQADLIVHVLGLFRWRTGVDEAGRPRMRQISETRLATAGTGSVQAMWIHLRLPLEGDPPREIVLGPGGLVPMRSTTPPMALPTSAYAEYLRVREDTLRLQGDAILAHIGMIRANVRFAVRIGDGEPAARAATVESLDRQLYPNWVLLDAGGPEASWPESETYLVWLRAGDLLHALALYWFAARTVERPAAIVIYADHDEFAPGTGRIRPSFKPDWSPDLFESRDYIGSAFCVRLLAAVPHLASCSGSYDLLLRVTEGQHRVEHVREIALHVPAKPGGAAAELLQAGEMQAIRARLSRTGRTGTVAPVSAGSRVYAVALAPGAQPRISVILALASRDMPIDDPAGYAAASASAVGVFRAVPGLDIIVVVDALNRDRPVLECQGSGINVIEYGLERPSLAAMINLGAEEASGEFLLILDAPYRPFGPEDIFLPARQFAKAHIGIVGARVIYRSAGIAFDGLVFEAGFPMRRTLQIEEAGDEPIRNVSAVLSPLMTTRHLFRRVGGYAQEGLSGSCHLEYGFRCRHAGKMIATAPGCRFEDWRPRPSDEQPDVMSLREVAERCPGFISADPYRTSPT